MSYLEQALESSSRLASSLVAAAGNAEDRKQRLKMYEDAKNYNSPQAEVNRLLAAGINPYGGAVSADQIADSIDLGMNPNQSIAEGISSIGQSLSKWEQIRLQRMNAETQMYNAETQRINSETNRDTAELKRDVFNSQKEQINALVQKYADEHRFFAQTFDYRVSQANLAYQINKFIRDKYSRESSWMDDNYDDLQDAILAGIKSNNKLKDFMRMEYYPDVMETNEVRRDLLQKDYDLRYDLAHPLGDLGNNNSANIFIRILQAILNSL